VAERIAAAVLAEHGRVEAVRVRVTKPHVCLDGGAPAGATVEIIRRRASVST
jgi:dihydroneopterin aldolase